MSGLAIELVRDDARFVALAAEWDDLVERTARPAPCSLHPWLVAWRRMSSPRAALAIAVARADGRIVGAFPLEIWRRRGVRVAEALDGLGGFGFEILLATDASPHVARTLVDAVRGFEFDVLYACRFRPDGVFAHAMPPRSLTVTHTANLIAETNMAGGWDELEARLRRRKAVREWHARRRRLERAGAVRIEIARSLPDVRRALPVAFRLNELRWAGRRDGSGFSTARGTAFHTEALLALAARDVVRIVTLELERQPIAFEIFLAHRGVATEYRAAFDPEFSAYAPGNVLVLEVLRAAAAEGLTRVDPGPGDERNKLAVADRIEPIHIGLALPRTLVGRVELARRVAVAAAGRRLRRHPRLHRLADRAARAIPGGG